MLPAESLIKRGTRDDYFSFTSSYIRSYAHSGRLKQMEADNKKGAYLLWLLHSAPALRPGFFREQVMWLRIMQIGSNVNNITISFKK